MDGPAATRHILAGPGEAPRIIMVTTFDLDQYVYAALRAGASGFLFEDVTPEQLVGAVRLVRSGDALLAPALTRRLVGRFARHDTDPPAIDRHLAAPASRELEVAAQARISPVHGKCHDPTGDLHAGVHLHF